METEALTATENLLSEILIMCGVQREKECIDSNFLFKVNELVLQTDPLLREVRHNKRELERAAFIRYQDDLERMFTGIIKIVGNLLRGCHITTVVYTGSDPDGFKIDQDYTVADVQQVLHNIFTYINGTIDREFSDPGTDTGQQASTPIRLKFTVDNKQIYDVFKQLKKEGWISNTYDQIADFVFHNIEFKKGNDPDLPTIRAQIGLKENRPIPSKHFTLPGK